MTDPLGEEITNELTDPPGELPGREDASLLFISGPDAGVYLRLPKGGGFIGRDTSVDFRISDPGVSRRHALVTRESHLFHIQDLGSSYGVYVEGRRVESSALRDGDRLQLSADSVLRIRYHDHKETLLLDRMHDAVIRDPLTGIANRRYFMRRLEQEYGFAIRHKAPLALLMVDLDEFKNVNDQFGHLAGDEFIFGIAHRLQDTVRVEDVVARYGGDEFVVCARGLDVEAGAAFAGRLCDKIRDTPLVAAGHEFRATLSVGVASFREGHPSTTMELIARADAALYAAKRGGRDRVAMWCDDPDTPSPDVGPDAQTRFS